MDMVVNLQKQIEETHTKRNRKKKPYFLHLALAGKYQANFCLSVHFQFFDSLLVNLVPCIHETERKKTTAARISIGAKKDGLR